MWQKYYTLSFALHEIYSSYLKYIITYFKTDETECWTHRFILFVLFLEVIHSYLVLTSGEIIKFDILCRCILECISCIRATVIVTSGQSRFFFFFHTCTMSYFTKVFRTVSSRLSWRLVRTLRDPYIRARYSHDLWYY